eukprot:GHVN01048197.1.p1 GENE.GHVN01048197.1~~GHVN01048197.1.p1  ORF type:complete len:363 (+),score=73.31 GHVN01048197.1:2138-3226(+)
MGLSPALDSVGSVETTLAERHTGSMTRPSLMCSDASGDEGSGSCRGTDGQSSPPSSTSRRSPQTACEMQTTSSQMWVGLNKDGQKIDIHYKRMPLSPSGNETNMRSTEPLTFNPQIERGQRPFSSRVSITPQHQRNSSPSRLAREALAEGGPAPPPVVIPTLHGVPLAPPTPPSPDMSGSFEFRQQQQPLPSRKISHSAAAYGAMKITPSSSLSQYPYPSLHSPHLPGSHNSPYMRNTSYSKHIDLPHGCSLRDIRGPSIDSPDMVDDLTSAISCSSHKYETMHTANTDPAHPYPARSYRSNSDATRNRVENSASWTQPSTLTPTEEASDIRELMTPSRVAWVGVVLALSVTSVALAHWYER